MKSFASDNYSGIHSEIVEALQRVNTGHASSYGNDIYSERAVRLFKDFFGNDCEVFFVYNGTGSNVLALNTLTKSFHSIICSELAHINVDESTAPEKFMGCKIIGIPSVNGKLYPDKVEERIQRIGDQHHSQAKVISISQTTEYGTVYTPDEILALSAIAKKYNLYFHIDGARIANAAVSLGESFRTFTRDVGVDVLSFGGTKNGMMIGEAIVFFNTSLALDFLYQRKQAMQLHSKMRFISAQFEALLSNNLWKRNALHANTMAKRLEKKLREIPQIVITQKVEANAVFAILPKHIIEPVQKDIFFYVWNEKTKECRFMCSFDTSDDDIDLLVQSIVKNI